MSARNVAKNKAVTLVVDEYNDADWSKDRACIVRGEATILTSGEGFEGAKQLSAEKYPRC